MANTKTAIKRTKYIRKRTLRNKQLKSQLKTAIKRFEQALQNGNKEEAQEKLRAALVRIDKSVTKGILHKNTAARKKSQLTRMYNNAVS
ncbi:MAG: 30S ribosomal protein S20 [Peptococcaceae bacterium]|nr:30S ribosomal protein S20 [Peptococcaceae bacterium]